MPFSIFQQPDPAWIPENENFFNVSIHYIYVALNEKGRQAMDSNVDPEKPNTECIQLCSLVLLYSCKVSGMLTEVWRKDRNPPLLLLFLLLLCFKVTKSFSEN